MPAPAMRTLRMQFWVCLPWSTHPGCDISALLWGICTFIRNAAKDKKWEIGPWAPVYLIWHPVQSWWWQAVGRRARTVCWAQQSLPGQISHYQQEGGKICSVFCSALSALLSLNPSPAHCSQSWCRVSHTLKHKPRMQSNSQSRFLGKASITHIKVPGFHEALLDFLSPKWSLLQAFPLQLFSHPGHPEQLSLPHTCPQPWNQLLHASFYRLLSEVMQISWEHNRM